MLREKRLTKIPVSELTNIVYANGTETLSHIEAIKELQCELMHGDNKLEHIRIEVCFGEVLSDGDMSPLAKCLALQGLRNKNVVILTQWVQDVVDEFVIDGMNKEIVFESERNDV